MNWYKQSSMNEEELNQTLKDIIKSHNFFKKLMKEYNIPISEIDNGLTFRIADLGEKYAEANSSEIILNYKLFENGNFFEDKFFYFVHEFYHWIKRKAENLFYFNDPEETQSFTLSIAWEILKGKEKTIYNTIYPIVKSHFKDEAKAKEVFSKMVLEAKEIAKKL